MEGQTLSTEVFTLRKLFNYKLLSLNIPQGWLHGSD